MDSIPIHKFMITFACQWIQKAFLQCLYKIYLLHQMLLHHLAARFTQMSRCKCRRCLRVQTLEDVHLTFNRFRLETHPQFQKIQHLIMDFHWTIVLLLELIIRQAHRHNIESINTQWQLDRLNLPVKLIVHLYHLAAPQYLFQDLAITVVKAITHYVKRHYKILIPVFLLFQVRRSFLLKQLPFQSVESKHVQMWSKRIGPDTALVPVVHVLVCLRLLPTF